MKTREIVIGSNLRMGGDNPIVIQTMCNTHTSDVEASTAQCIRLAKAGAQLIRLTVPGPKEVEAIAEIRRRLRAEGICTPLVADIHFSSETAIAAAAVVEKVRINPGNFHKDHEKAREQFARLVEVCKEHGTTLRIGLNHGSLGSRITELYGNTPLAMKEAAMEWLRMCRENDFERIVVSLKASNTLVMVEAYRLLARAMEEEGMDYPFHLGVTEAGNGDSARIKSVAAISALLDEGIGDTIRVSLTEDPECELPVAAYLAARYARGNAEARQSSIMESSIEGRTAQVRYAEELCSDGRRLNESDSNTLTENCRQRIMLDYAADWGRKLMDRELDEVHILSSDADFAAYLEDELLQACRRRFYRPEYIACPGCGRTMYKLEETFNEVKRRTAHLKGVVIAVMGCIVNGPGEMADADWGYVGEGAGKVTIYKGKTPVLKHINDTEAIDRLLELIESDSRE